VLYDFLIDNRANLIDRCRKKVAQRSAPASAAEPSDDGLPLFLDQLIKTLEIEQTPQPLRSRKVSGPSGGGKPVLSEIGETAARHGKALQTHGFTIEQVVHDYGDLCQSITDLAFEVEMAIETDEFRTLNRCLDNAIANAVTEFSYQRDSILADTHAHAWNERLGFFAHELRNLIHTATLALAAIKAGNVGVSGATAGILERSLVGARNLVDRSLAEVRIAAGLPIQHRLFSLAEFVAEVRSSASLEAVVHGCTLNVAAVEPLLAIDADRDLLMAAVGNLLQNAFKFTHHGTEVTLNAYAVADRILIDVEDNCGGLPAGAAATMFKPFVQYGANKTGLGLGLSIARLSVESNSGMLSVRDIPGSGCVFTIDLPRHSLPKPVAEPAALVV
jgi:signal transduction histidine kinase